MKRVHWLTAILLATVIALPPASLAEVTTTRDDKGVWFIKGDEADSLYDVFQEMGYAVATDRLWQMEKFRRSANGTLAEIFGAGADNKFLNQDILVRVTGYSDAELSEGFNSLDAETQNMIQGYVAGINKRIDEVSADLSQLPFEFHALGQKLGLGTPLIPDDWTPEDILAWEATLLRQFDPGAQARGQLDNARLIQYLQTVFGDTGMEMFNDLRWQNDPAAQTYIPESQALAGTAAAADPTAAKTATIAKATSAPAEKEKALVTGQKITAPVENLWAERVETLKQIDAYVKMGSYAWVVGSDKTATGRPIIYSGPQMGFSVPSIVMEGSIEAAGLNISGMAIPGLPGIVIGRTPHHAWSMQVGHAHTVDYYFETKEDVDVTPHRTETIKVAGQANIEFPVYRSDHGPIISPRPYNPSTYTPAPDNPIVAWRYSHWGKEFGTLKAFLNLARARSMNEFGDALRNVAVSQHFCYADQDGNIAYWMSGMDPERPEGYDYRFPQGMMGLQAEWNANELKPLSTDRNTAQGFYGGWNNKSSPDYPNSPNNMSYFFGPFHRAHVIEEYLETHDNLTFEEIRDLALNIATTDSIRKGGNPWAFVEADFRDAINNNPSPVRTQALAIMDGFDGHFVKGGPAKWVDGKDRSDAWMLANTWIQEVIDLTFMDELGNENSGVYNADAAESDNNVYAADSENPEKWKNPTVLFNVILHGLNPDSAISNNHSWFDNVLTTNTETAEGIIVTALDNALAKLGGRPWGVNKRGTIEFKHELLDKVVHTIPFASRSTYAHCVEMDYDGPKRIESMFPLGESGNILADPNGEPQFDAHFFSMTTVFDPFAYRQFPTFDTGDSDDDDTCFIDVIRTR
ncbi:MAG: penicillin acylase family protein [Desulfobacteraceae bacterium]|nr:penicillin acylase family protein [Desulfobacteraceae bacterium]